MCGSLGLGNVGERAPKLVDAEIELFIEAWPDNLGMAAADAAEAIAAKYAEGYTFGEDGQTFNRRERFLSYSELAERLRKRSGIYVWPFTRAE